MKVTVYGPNLNFEHTKKGTFHVHAAGCGDARKYRYLGPADGDGWTLDVTCAHDVEADVYDWAPSEADGYELGDWIDEFWFAPCTAGIPTERPDPVLTVRVETGNAAMPTVDEVADCLTGIAARLRRGDTEGTYLDANGNKVATFTYAPETVTA